MSHRLRGRLSPVMKPLVTMLVAGALVLSSGVTGALAAIVAEHEITANWQPQPASVQYGNVITAEWHINTNDAEQPESNEIVENVRVTLSAVNGKFASLPSVCKTSGVTPVSSLSADAVTLVCNLGAIEAGTATVIQTPMRATSTTGAPLSGSGIVESDTSVAPAGPASLPPVPVTYVYNTDLLLEAPSSNPAEGGQRGQYVEGTQRRERMIVDFAIRSADGSRPAAGNYTFTVNITAPAGTVMSGIQFESCDPVNGQVAEGIPFSSTNRADRATFPTGCTVTRLSAPSYRVALTGIDWSLTKVPAKDSKGAALPAAWNYIASGALTFSNPYPIDATTTFTYNAVTPAWTYPGTSQTSADPPANNSTQVTLYAPGHFSNRWAGSPTAGSSPWDGEIFVSPNEGASWVPGQGGSYLPLYMQANSLVWNDYTGAGGANIAGVCTMNQTATSFPSPESNNFVLKYMDGGGYDPARGGYLQMSTARFWYTTANIDTHDFTCNQGTWTQLTPTAGAPFGDPRQAGTNIVALPANVTAIKITWNPAVDKPYQVLVRGFGAIKSTATAWQSGTVDIRDEGWTVGSYNSPAGWANESHPGSIAAATPWSAYTGAANGTNGWRDPFRIVGNTGLIRKAVSPQVANPGDPVTFTVRAQTVSELTPPVGGNFTVVDTLPPQMDFVPGSATIDGVPITPTVTAVGTNQERLTFTITGSPANVDRVIVYQAVLPTSATVAPGTTLTNSAVINVPNDSRPVADRTATASVVVANNGATTFAKSVDDTYLAYGGDSSEWRLTVASLDPVSNGFTDTIDVLPYLGDDNGTSIDGDYTVTSAIVPASTWRVYYTTTSPGSLTDDPRHASNGTAPGAIAGNTVGWTVLPAATTVAIPASATAVRIIGPALAPGATAVIRLPFTTPAPTGVECAAPAPGDNKPGQTIVNTATSYAGHTRLPMISSAITTIADCNEVQLKKYVLTPGGDPDVEADWHDAQDVPDYPQYTPGAVPSYRIVVTNKGTGTLSNLVVTDPTVPGCAFTIPSLAAGASATNLCAGPAATVGSDGLTVNVATVNVTPPLGAPLTASDPAGIKVPLPPEITKTADPASGSAVDPGSEVEYTVTVTQSADSPAPFESPSLTDSLASVLDDAAFVAGSIQVETDLADHADPGSATISGSLLTWSADAIYPGETITIRYRVLIDDPADGDDRLVNAVTPGSGMTCADCSTEHFVPDLEFTKTADTGVANPGDAVTYTVTVENTGQVDFTVPAYPAHVVDDLAGVLDDATLDTGSLTNGATWDGSVIEWEGALAVGATTTFQYTVVVDDPATGDDRMPNRIVSDTPGSNCPDGSTDPACDHEVLVQSYVVSKSTPETPVVSGDVVRYEITVTNTGEVPYTGAGGDVASFEDELAEVLDDAVYNGDATGGMTFDGVDTLGWSGALPVGASLTFSYSVTVRGTVTDYRMDNVVAPTGAGGDCLAAGACDTSTPIAEFHVEKTADVSFARPGGTVHYVITVTNTGEADFDAAFPASFRDSFAGVVDDGGLDALDDDGELVPGSVSASAGTVGYDAPVLAWEGPLPVGGTVTIEYDVIVDDPDRGDHLLLNTITTPPGLANCDTGSGDAACLTETPIQSFRTEKSASHEVVVVGDVVTYTIEVTNTGEVAYPADPGAPSGPAAELAEFTDSIADVLLDADYVDGSVTATSGTATWDAGTSTIGWSGELPVGPGVVTISYQVTVTDVPDSTDRMVNTVVTPPDRGGNCEPGSTDPACNVEVPKRSYDVEKTADAATVLPGGTVTYTITVTNTGAEDYTAGFPAAIRDDLADVMAETAGTPVFGAAPAGWTIEPFLADPGDSADPDYRTFIASGPLAVGESVVLEYTVEVEDPIAGDGRLDNRVVTPPDRGGSCTVDATDPRCDETVLVQEFTVEKSVDQTVVENDDTVVYTVTVRNTGQVAYTGADAATSAGFVDDLGEVLDDAAWNGILVDAAPGAVYSAATETLAWHGALPVDGVVVIRYAVTAAGGDEYQLLNDVDPDGAGGRCADLDACATEVLIRAFQYSKAVDATSATEGDEVAYTVTVTNIGAVDYTAGDPAGITDDLSDVLDDASLGGPPTIDAPGRGDAEVTGSVLSWTGPLDVGETVVVRYAVEVDDPDTGDHWLDNAITGVPGSGGDCDPDESCETHTPVRSYLVEKSVAEPSAEYGDTIHYTITVTNTGAVDYDDAFPAAFSDDLSDVLDVSDGPDALAATSGTVAYDAETIDWSGPLAIGATVTVTYEMTVHDPVAGGADYLLENEVTVPDGRGGECGDCATITPIAAYDVEKTVDVAEAVAGDTVVYTITVRNLGQVPYFAPGATFVDDLSGVLDDAAGDPVILQGGATYDPGTQQLSWSGALPVGATVVVRYSVVVAPRADVPGADGILDNAVVGGVDCPPAGGPGCATETPVRSLHIVKTVSDAVVLEGDTVTYTITITNDGGADFTGAEPARISDNLSRIIDDGGAPQNLQADRGDVAYAAPTLTWSGALAAGEVAIIGYEVTIASPNLGDDRLGNTVVTPPGVPSNCALGSTDPACSTETIVKSFQLAKTANATEFFPGDVVVYTITLTNTGQAAYDAGAPVSFTDDLSDVLDDAEYNEDATGGLAWAEPVLSWSGALAVGEVLEFTYSVTLDDPRAAGSDNVLDNRVVNPPGIGGNCAETSADPVCRVELGGPSTHVAKTSSRAQAFPGDVVEYSITITNDGGIAFTTGVPAELHDDLAEVLDDASYNGDATNGATVDGDILTWSGPLAVGESVTIEYSVTINAPATGDGLLDNVVSTPPGVPSNCSEVPPGSEGPGDPEASTDPDCATRTLVKNYRTVKTAVAPSKVVPGAEIVYTIEVTNTGLVDYTADDPATFTDDFSGVLDDARYLGNADGGATYVDPELRWSGPLAVGETVYVTYSFVVSPTGGDNRLRNAVFSPMTIGGSCFDVDLPGCELETLVERPLASTGQLISMTVTATIVLIGLGGILLALGYRRRGARTVRG